MGLTEQEIEAAAEAYVARERAGAGLAEMREINMAFRAGFACAQSAAADPAESATDGPALIAAERKRQIEQEGWTTAHDDRYGGCELLRAAQAYLMCGHQVGSLPPDLWPWDAAWWKPGDEVSSLVKAGALIAAEIDRLKRTDHRQPQEVAVAPKAKHAAQGFEKVKSIIVAAYLNAVDGEYPLEDALRDAWNARGEQDAARHAAELEAARQAGRDEILKDLNLRVRHKFMGLSSECEEATNLLRHVLKQAGNEAPAERRHALTPGLLDTIQGFLNGKECGLLSQQLEQHAAQVAEFRRRLDEADKRAANIPGSYLVLGDVRLNFNECFPDASEEPK